MSFTKNQGKKTLRDIAGDEGIDPARILIGYLDGKAGELYSCQAGIEGEGDALKSAQNVLIRRFAQDCLNGRALYHEEPQLGGPSGGGGTGFLPTGPRGGADRYRPDQQGYQHCGSTVHRGGNSHRYHDQPRDAPWGHGRGKGKGKEKAISGPLPPSLIAKMKARAPI